MPNKFYTIVLSFALACFCSSVFAQVTTATLVGQVSDAKKEPVIGANITAVHIPSGSQYRTVSGDDGHYIIPNMRVGGPYSISVTSVSLKEQKVEGIYLNLGQKTPVDLNMVEENTTLGALEVTANANSPINGKRTGASTNVSGEQIRALPTISRSISDYTRLDPSSDGNPIASFGGRHVQFNNYSLDGAIFNNPFGLDAPTPGGQTDAQPVSLDAIEQVQVATAPYDVTQAGFSGASINSVTKSGTNNFQGTVYGFYRNQDMTGKTVDGTDIFVPKLNQGQYGFSVGGPLIQNKLFFFANAEIERRSDLGSSFVAARPGLTGANVSRVSAADLDFVSQTLKSKYGYETGVYEGFIHNTDNSKGIFKLDWNVAENHKITASVNFLDASKDKPANPTAIGRRGPDYTTLQFYNSGYRINNKLVSGIVEVKSVFGAKLSNKFQTGYSVFTDTRDPFSAPFPVVNIDKDGQRYIVAGHEPFSIFNRLNQRVFQLNDNFNIYLKKNTITVGAAYESFSFDNSFNLNAYGGTFGDVGSLADFTKAANDPASDLSKSVTAARALAAKNAGNDNNWNFSYLNVGQISAYVQDEIQLGKNFTVTAGVRMDVPTYLNTPDLINTKLKNADQACCYQPDIKYYNENGTPTTLSTTTLPAATPLFSPRVGFNWDIKGDRSEQLRGGTGIFTGRFPFVWLSNQVANPNFFFYCVTSPDFKFPQVWKSNLGYDKKLTGGWVLSGDFIYAKDINAMIVRNYGLKLPSGTLNAPGDNRPIYKATDHAVNNFGGNTDAYVFTNTNVGYSTNLTLQAKKVWSNGMFASFGYNYGQSYDASSVSAEISSDAYDRNPISGNTNTAVSAPSLYGNVHRLVGGLSKKFTYGENNKFGTTFSLFFQYVKGGHFSYTYSGDLNGDNSGNNDLVYVPTDAQVDQMKFSGDATAQSSQKAAFKSFIAQDDYMNTHRGSIVEKYGILNPWYNNWDVRVLQDFNIKIGSKINTFQVSLDLLNAGNLISSSWGVRKTPSTTQPIAVATDANGVPTYTFDTNLKNSFISDPGLISRWQLQLGLRYIFGGYGQRN